MTSSNVLNNYSELMFMRSRLAQFVGSSTKEIHVIRLKDTSKGYNGLPTVYDNINSSTNDYEIPDLIRVALKDMGEPFALHCIVTYSNDGEPFNLLPNAVVINLNDLVYISSPDQKYVPTGSSQIMMGDTIGPLAFYFHPRLIFPPFGKALPKNILSKAGNIMNGKKTKIGRILPIGIEIMKKNLGIPDVLHGNAGNRRNTINKKGPLWPFLFFRDQPSRRSHENQVIHANGGVPVNS